jgi:hypothetical protein
MSLISAFFETVSFQQVLLVLIAVGVAERCLNELGIDPFFKLRREAR